MYTEEDQFGIKLETREDVEKAKKRKKLVILISCIILAILLIVLIILLVFNYLNNQKEASLPVVRLSTTDWTNQPITLTVDNQKIKLISYSFDGGKTWQDENAIQVSENGVYTVLVKNEKGKVSKNATVSINNIDLEAPIIQFSDPLYVQKGGTYNYKTGISVTDNGSGVKEYSSDPINIDTANDGEYTVTYTAYDHVGNMSQKIRKVIVRNLITTTYYRSRSVKVEKYKCKIDGCNSEDRSCYTTCKRNIYGEWSEWTKDPIKATDKLEVETKIE